MLKRILPLLLSAVLLAGVTLAPAAAPSPASDQPELKGDFLVRDGVLTQYLGWDTVVTIPANIGVKQIAATAFAGCGFICLLNVPQGVEWLCAVPETPIGSAPEGQTQELKPNTTAVMPAGVGAFTFTPAETGLYTLAVQATNVKLWREDAVRQGDWPLIPAFMGGTDQTGMKRTYYMEAGKKYTVYPCAESDKIATYNISRAEYDITGLKVEPHSPGLWTLLVQFADGSESEPVMSTKGMRLNIHDLGYMELFIRSVAMTSGVNYTAVGTPGLPGMGTLLITDGDYVTPGDINEDRKVNVEDILILRDFIFGLYPLNGGPFFAADCEPDGTLNISDILVIMGIIFGENGKD